MAIGIGPSEGVVMAYNWKCPYCGNNSTINNQNYSDSVHQFESNNYLDISLGIFSRAIVCPNNECRKITIRAILSPATYASGWRLDGEPLETWNLLPSSTAIPFPEYVPQAIREDYEEACKIKDLSPKASATLSRRCLQGIIRDFWGVAKNRLIDEIDSLSDKLDPETWAAIDAVRKIGNIGAHMEKDINVMIDVEPAEADLLVGLIEMLVKDWYVARHKRKQHLQEIVEAADRKK